MVDDVEQLRKERMRYANETLSRLLNNYNVEKNVENSGLVKGQHVARHTRRDPKTGSNFVAGKGGTGSPERVLAEGKTVTANDSVGGSSGVQAEGSTDKTIDDPATIELIIRNLQNAPTEKLQQMANDLFLQPRTRQRGILAELMLKEILLRGVENKSNAEEETDQINQEKTDLEAKQKEKDMKAKEKKKSANPSKP